MPSIEITYADKSDRREFSDVPENEKVVAANMNELKTKFNALSAKVDALRNPSIVTITDADFSGSYYQNTLLIGLTPATDFKLFTNGGSGTILPESAFAFSAELGRITIEAGDYVLLITKPQA